MNDDQHKKLADLARQVLEFSRNRLLIHLRFMDVALSRLELMEAEKLTFATDGRSLAYDPGYVLRRYKAEAASVVRDYLHIVLHCVFRHMFVGPRVDHTAWDLACDIAVEKVISTLGLQVTSVQRESEQKSFFWRLSKKVGNLTAERVYRFLLEGGLSPAEMADLRGLFYADDHQVWYLTPGARAALGLPGQGPGNRRKNSPWSDSRDDDSESSQSDGENRSREDASGQKQDAEPWECSDPFDLPAENCSREDGGEEEDGGEDEDGDPAEDEIDWDEISRRIQMDVESFSRDQGLDPSGLLQNLRPLNRERVDYGAFLRRFAVLGNEMKVSQEEFDYVLYSYGLELYGNMPLIEPLEFREVKRIREFVVAIDTSGSVRGEMVQAFVQKTWDMLKSSETFFSRINLHVIQCDATIQEDARITSQQELDDYFRTMQIHGLGGTDFRPVFQYVDWLREKGELQDLRGLVYFTDGWGTFPEKKPNYQTAFVFLAGEENNVITPPWAIRLELSEEEILY